jgi:hypothetical protein
VAVHTPISLFARASGPDSTIAVRGERREAGWGFRHGAARSPESAGRRQIGEDNQM